MAKGSADERSATASLCPDGVASSGQGAARGLDVPYWLQRSAALGWRVLVVGAAVYYAAVIIATLRIVTVPLLLGVFMAALLRPAARFGERVMPASLAALISVTLVALGLAGTLVLLGFGVAGQVRQFRDAATRGWQRLSELAAQSPLGDWTESGDLASSVTEELQSRAAVLASGVASGGQAVVTVVSQLLLATVFTFFFVRDGRWMFDSLVKQLSQSNRSKARRAGDRAWRTLGRYLRGLSLIALCNATLKALALLAIGVPLILPIAILTFLGSFIPFAGPIIAGSVAALVALADGGWVDAALVVGAALCIQALEGNVLQPLVLGRTMRLHPVLILAGVAVGTILAGLAGAFVAVPVLAVLVKVLPDLRGGENEGDGGSFASEAPSD